ncbi:nucleoid-associated protein [Enterococcus sp. BWB1-3]|uniref:nucleoid-associated protein n=1 Tax=Enterococcus sp. BWB1-3 TaxID=2787713 RepID=UPI001922DE91|nr:nucleoid-associated protein [Enterococcus sp. BWB1-3]MBL1230745.1 nucleoid-associated protein [Enterococcus sp. BWB1-3]
MEIIINRLIVHKLNLRGNQPVLNDTCIDIEEVEDFEEALNYFKIHISNSRKQSFMRRCQFMGLENNTVKLNVERIMSNKEVPELFEETFIKESQAMTKKLFSTMKSTSSRSDGSLFFLYYTMDQKEYIGIIKMDPNTGVEIDDNLKIKVRKSMLPSVNEKLHKLAFIAIKNSYLENEFHLYVLDRQNGNKDTAQYFMDIFLNAKILSNNTILTQEIEKELITGFQEEIIPNNKWPKFSNAVKNKLNSGELFNIDEDIPSLVRPFLDKKNRDMDLKIPIEIVKANILKKHPDADLIFKPDVNFKKPIIYKSKNGEIEIRIKQGISSELVDIIPENEDGDFVVIVDRSLNVRNAKF